MVEIPASLAHRRVLDHAAGFRPFAGTDLFTRIGGQPTVDRLVDVLYDRFEDDLLLRPLFPRDLSTGRSQQKLFFAQWLGGPGRFSEESHAGLAHRHEGVPITRTLAGRWLGHLARALEVGVPAERDRTAIFAQARSLAAVLVTEPDRPARRDPDHRRGVASCGPGARILKQATDVARRGDVEGTSAVLDQAPDLLRPTYAARLMHAAAWAGRVEVVRLLVRRGVGPDSPHHLPVGITGRAFERVVFVTPLCAARRRRRAAVESVLVEAGAHDDVFTAALLGDEDRLAPLLATDPGLAYAPDPAVDVLDITPVDHAVAAEHVGSLRLLLAHVPRPLRAGVRALRGAAEKGSLTMVELLLDHGADPTRIGAGRWVLHPRIAPLLSGRGASVDSSGSWIGASCTGNQGRSDDPDYVRALLRHGARADDRRNAGPDRTSGVASLDATALHFAAKAGFVQTIGVLLEHGADPLARDSRGRTPSDWVEDAAPSVARAEVRRALTQGSGAARLADVAAAEQDL